MSSQKKNRNEHDGPQETVPGRLERRLAEDDWGRSLHKQSLWWHVTYLPCCCDRTPNRRNRKKGRRRGEEKEGGMEEGKVYSGSQLDGTSCYGSEVMVAGA